MHSLQNGRVLHNHPSFLHNDPSFRVLVRYIKPSFRILVIYIKPSFRVFVLHMKPTFQVVDFASIQHTQESLRPDSSSQNKSFGVRGHKNYSTTAPMYYSLFIV